MGCWKAFGLLVAGVLSTAPAYFLTAQHSPAYAASNFFPAPDLPGKERNEKTPPPIKEEEARPSSDSCDAAISESEGVVHFSVSDAARAGKTMTVSVDDFGDDPRLDYDAQFDASGNLTLTAPIFHEDAPLRWEGSGGAACRQTVRFAGFDHAFRAALIWTGAGTLALHVVEPTGAIGSANHYVSPSHPNIKLGPGSYGLMREFENRATQLHVQFYAIPSGQNPHDKAPVGFHVENVARGNPATPPFCGDGPMARTAYQVIFQQDGQPPKMIRRSFAPVACGFSWKEMERSFDRLPDMRM